MSGPEGSSTKTSRLGADATYEILNPPDHPYSLVVERVAKGQRALITVNPTNRPRTIHLHQPPHSATPLLSRDVQWVEDELYTEAYAYAINILTHVT